MKIVKMRNLVFIIILSANSVVYGHGDVTPQAVDTSELEVLGDEWKTVNPYRENTKAIEVGKSAYAQNCARCHGLDAISGGITPDLRKLNNEEEWDSIEESDQWFLGRIRNGAVIDGRVFMPPFGAIMNQEAMWAIRSYLDTRKYEE